MSRSYSAARTRPSAVLASAVYFGPAGRFLSSAGIEGTEDLPEVRFNRVEPLLAESSFTLGGFTISLTQIVATNTWGARLSQIAADPRVAIIEKDGLVGQPDHVGRREVLIGPDGHPI